MSTDLLISKQIALVDIGLGSWYNIHRDINQVRLR